MYPPISSPTSPQDVQMADLNILSAKDDSSAQSPMSNHSFHIGDHTAISTAKSMDTLRNNIDVRSEIIKKRTSLILNDNGNNELNNGCESSLSSTSSSSLGQQPIKLATVKRCSRNLDNARYRFEHRNDNANNNNRSSMFDHSTTTGSSSSSSTDSDSCSGNGNGKTNIEPNANHINENMDNGKLRRLRRKSQADKSQASSKTSSASNQSDADGGPVAIDNDRRNGNCANNSDISTQKRDSVTSKESGSATTASDDYFLCEKFKNSINAKLCSDVLNTAVVIGNEMDLSERQAALELLSPHEGPLGRRYAEIASNKATTNNKW